jgi:hypothetical protein
VEKRRKRDAKKRDEEGNKDGGAEINNGRSKTRKKEHKNKRLIKRDSNERNKGRRE